MERNYSVSGSTDDVSACQRSPSKTDKESMKQAMELEDLLRPSQFDWADESEELEGVEEAEGQSEGSVGEGELEETMASFYDLERQPSIRLGEPENEWPDFDKVMVQETTLPEPDYEELKRASMQEDVNQEFAFRQGWMEVAGESIHHFNWLGSPRYEYSSTPAAISLLFLFTAPKIPEPGDEWRLNAIMRRAMRHVDPVVLYPENGREDFRLRGFELVRWATGRVFKFYSPHGNWQTDPDDIADGTHMDSGDVNMYMGSTLQFGNGYVRDYTIRSRAQWGDEQQRLYAEKFPAPSQTRSPKTPYKPSRLRQCTFPDELEDSAEAEPSVKPEIDRLASQIPRMRRAFSESTPDLLAGLQRETSVHGFESGLDAMIETSSEDSDNDDDFPDIGEFVQLSYEEFKDAERRRTDIIERAAIAPGLETIPEEDVTDLKNEPQEAGGADMADNIEPAQDNQGDQMVEQEQEDQSIGIVMQNQNIQNNLAVEQAGENDQNDHDQHCLQTNQLVEYGQRGQNEHKIGTPEQENNGQVGQNNQVVEQHIENQNEQLGQNDQIAQNIETVEQVKNDQDYNGQIDQFGSIDTTDQKQKDHQHISTGTHRTSSSNIIYYISNESKSEAANVQTVVSEPSSPPTDQRNEKWKKRISHISQKARSALRSKDARFSPKSNSSGSFESTSSPTSNCDPDRQYISLFHTEILRDGGERPHKTSSTKELATKVKRVLSRSSSENDTARPKKQRRITFSDLFYEGIWAFESFPMVMA
ncbi:hypothetical protein SI65_06670 [Aspergillus cristatus]|uniref:Uncharacterized protein n=1 Tax=Aspergillus cristatus TaxID=573508 RepID=A0A1E3BA89_ASPCR|nr:hypothetical protein SI65_06670 [Aspergillus cristatus]